MDCCQAKVLKSQAYLANRNNRNRVSEPFKVRDLVYFRNHPVSHTG